MFFFGLAHIVVERGEGGERGVCVCVLASYNMCMYVCVSNSTTTTFFVLSSFISKFLEIVMNEWWWLVVFEYLLLLQQLLQQLLTFLIVRRDITSHSGEGCMVYTYIIS